MQVIHLGLRVSPLLIHELISHISHTQVKFYKPLPTLEMSHNKMLLYDEQIHINHEFHYHSSMPIF